LAHRKTDYFLGTFARAAAFAAIGKGFSMANALASMIVG
jgi:hypothetical protein